MTIEFNQFDNIRFVVFGKFCFEETKRSHTKTKNEKRRTKLVNSLKKIFFDIEIFRNVFCFSISNKNETKQSFFFRGAIKNELFDHKKNETLTFLSMRAHLAARDWPAHLPWVLLGLRAAPKEDHNISAAELLYGAPLALPGELLETSEPPAASFLENLRRCPTSIPTRPITGPQPSPDPPKGLSSASFVFVRRGAPGPPLSPLYDGPYQVLASGPKFFTLQVGDRQDTVSVDRL